MNGVLCALLALATSATSTAGSYLYQPSYEYDELLREPAEPYVAQPGDLFLVTNKSRFWCTCHEIALIGPPQHAGIVIARPDGSLALLEAGPFYTLWVEISDLVPQLCAYADREHERVWIRRRRVPLTAEQSAALTDFALRQQGKRFALIRVAAQLTPFRSRGPLRTYVMGGPHGDRCSYFCSELVMESCVAAGLLDPTTTRPAATFPGDIFFDHSRNRYINAHLHLANDWYPPARWASHGEP